MYDKHSSRSAELIVAYKAQPSSLYFPPFLVPLTTSKADINRQQHLPTAQDACRVERHGVYLAGVR